MPSLSKKSATALIEQLELEEPNRVLANHWLSLSADGELPPRNALKPANIKQFLPQLLILDVVPDKRVTVRLMGTRIGAALGVELSGQDWIALAPVPHRAERLRCLSQIAYGAIGIARRQITLEHEPDMVCQEILLPFAAEPTGVSPVLVHINAKPAQFMKVKFPAQAMGAPATIKLVPLN